MSDEEIQVFTDLVTRNGLILTTTHHTLLVANITRSHVFHSINVTNIIQCYFHMGHKYYKVDFNGK